MREAQLASVMSNAEADRAALELSRSEKRRELQSLELSLHTRNEQLMAMVRELCTLAADENKGVVNHEVRGRLFRRSVGIFESVLKADGVGGVGPLGGAAAERGDGRKKELSGGGGAKLGRRGANGVKKKNKKMA